MIKFFYACTEAEAPLTEYERQRAQTMMRNNQVLRSLRVTTLASIVNSSSAKKKVAAREDSGSLYEPQETDGTDDDVVDKMTVNKIMSTARSKRLEEDLCGTCGTRAIC